MVSETALGEKRHARGQGCGEDGWRVLDVVRLATVARHAVHADLDLGRVAKVGFVEVFRADIERGKLG